MALRWVPACRYRGLFAGALLSLARQVKSKKSFRESFPRKRESRDFDFSISLTALIFLSLFSLTSAQADNAASSCGLTTINNGSNTCYIVTPTPTDGLGITIDGIESGGEWTSAQSKNLGGDFVGSSLRVFRSNNALYLLISINDATENLSDEVRVYIDAKHNHGTITDDITFVVRRDLGGGANHRKISNAGDNPWEPGALGSELAVTGVGSPWKVEIKLTAAELGLGQLPSVIGFGARAQDINTGNLVKWPLNLDVAGPATTWANLKFRYPIDYGLVMDYSGSMQDLDGGTQNRWLRAKRAADLFIASLSLFKDSNFNDRVGMLQYSWSCSNNNSGGNTTGSVQGISSGTTPITVPSTPPTGNNSFTSGNNIDPPGNNCTPIQTGLEYALRNTTAQGGIFGPVNDAPDHTRLLVLLSDGFHNMPSGHGDFEFNVAGPFTNTERNAVHVRTVALGPDGSSGTNLLSAISAAFKGAQAPAGYNNVVNFADLLNAYLETLGTGMVINQVDRLGDSFLPGAPEKLVFVGVWNNAAQAGRLKARRDGVDVVATARYENTRIGYAAVVIDNPTAGGTWTLELDGAASAPDQKYAFIDLRINAQVKVKQKQYGTGEPILLQVDLKDHGLPHLGAEATVEIFRPGEGLGNYLSTVQIDCSLGIPRVPGDRIRERDDEDGGVIIGASHAIASATSSGDPLPGRYALATAHFKRCQKDGLDRVTLPGVNLYDDGSHGDSLAGDGVYSLSYADTTLEGTYTFRFHVRGTTADAIDFSRTRTISQYVTVNPQPESTPVVFQPINLVGGIQTTDVYILPKDNLGNYVGPGFVPAFTVSSTLGQLVGPLRDVGNGYYVQRISYPAKGTKPVITIGMPSTCFTKVINVDQSRLWLWLLILLVALLIFLIWYLIIRRHP